MEIIYIMFNTNKPSIFIALLADICTIHDGMIVSDFVFKWQKIAPIIDNPNTNSIYKYKLNHPSISPM